MKLRKKKTAKSTEATLTRAIRLQGEGRLEQAEELFHRVLDSEPTRVEALHRLGVLAYQTGRSEAAVKLLRRALTQKPWDGQFHRHLAVALAVEGQGPEALLHAQQAVSLEPDSLESLYNLGSLQRLQGHYQEAADTLDEVVARHPGHYRARNNLGLALAQAGQIEQAAAVLEETLQQAPAMAEAYHNLGLVRQAQGRIEEAVALYQESLRLEPLNPGAFYSWGCVLRDAGFVNEGCELFIQSLKLDPTFWRARLQLAEGLLRLGLVEQSITQIRAVLEQQPDQTEAAHLLMVASGQTPERADNHYVTTLFDEYAETFDYHLVNQLGYQGPAMLFDLHQRVAPGKGLRVLDAGCGTGLCGKLFAEVADALVGVDLSHKMLERALGLRLYQQLHQADLLEFLAEHPGAFDRIVAGDLLIYLGRPEPFLEACHQALAADGWVFFTAEVGEQTLELRKTGRFAHSPQALATAAQAAGFVVEAIEIGPLRVDCGRPLEAVVVALRKA